MALAARLLDVRSSLRARREFDRAMPVVRASLGVGSVRSLARFRRNGLDVLAEADAYGDIARLDLLYKSTCFVKHPDAVEELFASQDLWRRGEGLVPLIGRNMLSSNGARWSEYRTFAQPSFHPKMTERAADRFARDAAGALDDWVRFVADGATFDVALECVRVFARFATRAFGFDLREDEAHRFPTVMLRLQRWAFAAVAGGNPVTPRIAKDRAFLDTIIARALATPAPAGEPPTYLERLRQDHAVARESLRDQLMLALIAPGDNPPNATAFTLWELARHREHEDAVRREVRAVLGNAIPTSDALERLPLLERVVQEAMRLYPPVWILVRFPEQDAELLGHRIPAGTAVWAPPYFVHRHPKFWDDPKAFRPERFLPEAVAARHRYAYLPFGAGPRMCIGARLATREIRMLIAMFLQRYRIEPLFDGPLPLEGTFGLRSRAGMPARLLRAEGR